jgi:DNA-binding phage protein
MTMPVKDYHSGLLIRLADPEHAALYLKAALEAALEDGDREAFVLALSNVAEAQEMSRTAAGDANRVYEEQQAEAKQSDSLSVETLLSVLDSVGLTMEFKSAPL